MVQGKDLSSQRADVCSSLSLHHMIPTFVSGLPLERWVRLVPEGAAKKEPEAKRAAAGQLGLLSITTDWAVVHQKECPYTSAEVKLASLPDAQVA